MDPFRMTSFLLQPHSILEHHIAEHGPCGYRRRHHIPRLTSLPGIVSYSQAWRGYDEEIQNVKNKAKARRMLLKTLRDTIEELQQTRSEVAADLEEKAMSMQSSIEKLKRIVDRFKTAQSEAFPDKVRAQLKKGVYYFQKDALQDMQNHLDQIQNVLQTSLLMWV